MPLKVRIRCHCGAYVRWLYDEDEEEIHPQPLTGCPAKSCREFHELTIRQISGEEEDQLRNKLKP